MIPLIVFVAALSAAEQNGARTVLSASDATAPVGCLSTGDGYLKAHLAGAVDADIDWKNADTDCAGEARPAASGGVRLSFKRTFPMRPDLVFVFGITGVREGEPVRDAGANVTVIVQGTSHIYSTRGDSRCTVDVLKQRQLHGAHLYRLEVRGFCTQPAREVRGAGEILVSRFDFAGHVDFGAPDDAAP